MYRLFYSDLSLLNVAIRKNERTRSTMVSLQILDYSLYHVLMIAKKEVNTTGLLILYHSITFHIKIWATSLLKEHAFYVVHDDVIKGKHYPRYWPFVQGIHRSPVNSPHKGQWRGALMFSLICIWLNGWVNNREADDLRRYCAHYDVTVMWT